MVRLHRGTPPDSDILEYEGFHVTTPVRTLLDTAAGNLDLDQLISAMRDACEREPATKQALLLRADELGERAALRTERALRLGGLL
jgi:hypothetical protein